jgi:hypothetical protein
MGVQQGLTNNNMDIAVTSITAEQLISGKTIQENNNVASNKIDIQGQLNLPEYQRPYRWSFTDVKALLSDLDAYFSVEDTSNKPLLYMGSVVLHQAFDAKTASYVLNIIDGQQRITTLSLICMAIAAKSDSQFTLPSIEFGSPVSHERIAKNYQWLLEQIEDQSFSSTLMSLNLSRINFTLVVTQSEDEAYRFFETQNTGGVRLTGPQVIKAHHLRAIPNALQSVIARKWESLDHLDNVVGRLLKARRWQAFGFKNVPSHRAPEFVKKAIVNEFAEKVSNYVDDLAFSRGAQKKGLSGAIYQQMIEGYLAKQPLNAGINTVHYLDYFNTLYQSLIVEQSQPYLQPFYDFYGAVVESANNSDFLTELYDIAILLYVSEFGTEKLVEAAYWLARCVFSIRLKNKKTVFEISISSFVRECSVLDWITTAYQHQQLIEHLQNYQYLVSSDNIGNEFSGVKQQFLGGLANHFTIDIENQSGEQLAKDFDKKLKYAIKEKLANNSINSETQEQVA